MTVTPEKDPIGNALLDYLNNQEEGVIRVDTNITEDEAIPTSYFFRDYRYKCHNWILKYYLTYQTIFQVKIVFFLYNLSV